MYQVLLVAIGGGIGATLRYLTNIGALRILGSNALWGTAGINILGSFAMGLFIEFLARRFAGSPELREEGGRIWGVFEDGESVRLSFQDGAIDFRKVAPGQRIWKTSDPALERELAKTWDVQ